ncbi:hypothetical protein F2P81_021570 [Scophthalmus maximus]|uniref:Uncharacterized protein n=1 Tax=Scophthalmus maximus TaxID=52904 RepID=A0A6A4RXR1_SCOMX|nr:hypothetical protein F2P81_021570 [Scophthalmus maximus]
MPVAVLAPRQVSSSSTDGHGPLSPPAEKRSPSARSHNRRRCSGRGEDVDALAAVSVCGGGLTEEPLPLLRDPASTTPPAESGTV